MKKIKNIVIMLIVLVLLLIAYLVFSPLWRENTGGNGTTEAPAYDLPDITAESLVGVEITVSKEAGAEGSDGSTADTSGTPETEKVTSVLSFSLSDDHTSWHWSEDADIPLDNVAFANIVTAINEATSKYKLESVSNAELAEFGLEDPYIRARFTFADGSSREIKIGVKNSFNSLYYFVDLSEPTTVYMVAGSVPEALDLEIYDFVFEETPPEIKESNIISLTYSTPRGNRTYTYYPTGKESEYTNSYLWYCTDNYGEIVEYPVDEGVAKALVSLVTEMGFDSCIALDYLADSGEYDFTAQSTVEIRYKADSGESGVLTEKTYVLHIGSVSDDRVVVRTDNSKLVYVIDGSEDWKNVLDGEREKIAPDELWLPNYERVDSMEFTVGDNALTVKVINKDGKISFESDATDDSDAISALLKSLQDLSATSNTAYFEGDPSAEKKTVFSLALKLNSGDNSELEMKIETYSEKYCRVYFNGRDDQLITLEDAQTFADEITELFDEK